MWLRLSENLYCFGATGINRIEEITTYKVDGSRAEYQTALFVGATKITAVKESVEEIETLLKGEIK